MATNAVLTVGDLAIPRDVYELQGFRDWARTLDEHAPLVSFYAGSVHVEMNPQNVLHHAPLVAEVNGVLHRLARDAGLGRYYVPPTWVTHEPAQLSTEPDGLFVSFDAFRDGTIRVEPARPTELLGVPTMVFEAVSRTSARKDLVVLREAYARAGVREYWVADARAGLAFEVLQLGADGAWLPSAPDAEGWLASSVFGGWFRLQRITDALGLPDFRLERRETP